MEFTVVEIHEGIERMLSHPKAQKGEGQLAKRFAMAFPGAKYSSHHYYAVLALWYLFGAASASEGRQEYFRKKWLTESSEDQSWAAFVSRVKRFTLETKITMPKKRKDVDHAQWDQLWDGLDPYQLYLV